MTKKQFRVKTNRLIQNREKKCDFDVMFRGRKYHIDIAMIDHEENVVWYEGTTQKMGVPFSRLFAPSEIEVPK